MSGIKLPNLSQGVSYMRSAATQLGGKVSEFRQSKRDRYHSGYSYGSGTYRRRIDWGDKAVGAGLGAVIGGGGGASIFGALGAIGGYCAGFAGTCALTAYLGSRLLTPILVAHGVDPSIADLTSLAAGAFVGGYEEVRVGLGKGVGMLAGGLGLGASGGAVGGVVGALVGAYLA